MLTDYALIMQRWNVMQHEVPAGPKNEEGVLKLIHTPEWVPDRIQPVVE